MLSFLLYYLFPKSIWKSIGSRYLQKYSFLSFRLNVKPGTNWSSLMMSMSMMMMMMMMIITTTNSSSNAKLNAEIVFKQQLAALIYLLNAILRVLETPFLPPDSFFLPSLALIWRSGANICRLEVDTVYPHTHAYCVNNVSYHINRFWFVLIN